MATSRSTWAFIFRLLGNVISFTVFLAPIPTFYHLYKKKSAEGFQSLPYVVALFSSMLWIYYALVRKDASLLLLTMFIFLLYVPNKPTCWTIILILLLNTFGYGSMLLSTLYLTTRSKRAAAIGWIFLVFNTSVFAAPLCIMKCVIQNKRADFGLSFSLILNAIMWFFYGLLLRDFDIALANTLGFLFSIIQMVLYFVYRAGSTTAITNNL